MKALPERQRAIHGSWELALAVSALHPLMVSLSLFNYFRGAYFFTNVRGERLLKSFFILISVQKSKLLLKSIVPYLRLS